MKLNLNEKIIIKTRRFLVQAVTFPFKIGGSLCKRSYQNVTDIYLTTERIYAENLFFKIKLLDLPVASILYFKKEKFLASRIRIGYKENTETKEVLLTLLQEKDVDRWIEELNVLVPKTGSNIVQ